MENKFFLKDTALSSKNQDSFHHSDFVGNLKRIIEEHNPPFNIALVGKWGVGKSSIINMLKKELVGKDEYIVHEINAWKYENESLKKAFLKNLWKTLNKDKDTTVFKQFTQSLRKFFLEITEDEKPIGLWEGIKKAVPFLTILTSIWLVSSLSFLILFYIVDLITTYLYTGTLSLEVRTSVDYFMDKLWIPFGVAPFFALFMQFTGNAIQNKKTDIQILKPVETADEYEDLFKDEIEKYKSNNPKFKKLVVIVDDLDRLSSKKMVDALDAIKAFVDVEECIFIVTCDERILVRSLEKQKLNSSLEGLDGELFLDKLFQFRISLPPIIESDMREYAREITRQEAPSLVSLCNGQFDEVIKILVHAEITTPRQVKKVINNFANNLLIAKSREDGSRKLENELLTGEVGLKILAKLSVLQSDYNEIYIELIRDFKYLERILSAYYNGGHEGNDENRVSHFFKNKGTKQTVGEQYQGLINFLIMTQHITVENLAPFVYLGQDAIGLMAGDENRRQIHKNIVSGNHLAISVLLERDKSGAISLSVIEEVKNANIEDLPLVLSAAYQLIGLVSDESCIDLADIISIRIQEVSLENVRLWQVGYDDLLDVYFKANNKQGALDALNFVIDKLFKNHSWWRSKEGKELASEEFNQYSFELAGLLLKKEEYLDESTKKVVKDFISNNSGEYESMAIEYIHQLYMHNEAAFRTYFGIDFYNQLIQHINRNKKKLQNVSDYVNTVTKLLPLVVSNYPEQFIEKIHKSLSFSKSFTNKVLELVSTNIDKFTENHFNNVLDAFFEIGYSEEDDLRVVHNFISSFEYEIGVEDQEFITKLDEFIHGILPVEEGEQLNSFIPFFQNILSRSEGGFGNFKKVFDYIMEHVMKGDLYDTLLQKCNYSFTESQRSSFFQTINVGVLFNNYSGDDFSRTYTFYSWLVEQEYNQAAIKVVINDGITNFVNNRFTQKLDWADNFPILFGIGGMKEVLEEEKVKELVDRLLVYHAQYYPALMVRTFKYLGLLTPVDKAVNAIEKIINKANDESIINDSLFYLDLMSKHINKKNNNLNLVSNFLTTNVTVNPSKVFSLANKLFSKLSEDGVLKLFKGLEEIKKEQRFIIKKDILGTVTKFFDAVGDRKRILLERLISEVRYEILEEFLLSSTNDIIQLIEELMPQIEDQDVQFKKKLLLICANYQVEIPVIRFSNLFSSAFAVANDGDVDELFDTSITKYRDFRFGHTKKNVAVTLLQFFKRVNNEMKPKVLDIAKNFNVENEFKDARKNGQLTQEEGIIVLEVLKLRR